MLQMIQLYNNNDNNDNENIAECVGRTPPPGRDWKAAIYIYIYIYKHTCIYKQVYVDIYIYTYIYIYIHICVCIYIYIYREIDRQIYVVGGKMFAYNLVRNIAPCATKRKTKGQCTERTKQHPQRQAETILHRISVAYPLHPRLNVGFGALKTEG